MLIKDPAAFAKKLNSTVTNLDDLMDGVSTKARERSAKLATDDAAYTNLNKLLTSSATTFVATIRQDPEEVSDDPSEDFF